MSLISWFRSATAHTQDRRPARCRRTAQARHTWRALAFEPLEDRALPSLFGVQTPFAAGMIPISVAVADFNRDGSPDIAVANRGSNNVSVLLGNGSGGFGLANNFAAGFGPRSVAVGDFNRDGNPDLAVAGNGGVGVGVLLGNGLGGFGAAANFNTDLGPISVVVADLNRDGNPDLAVANNNPDARDVSVLLGNGLGGFAAAVNYVIGLDPVAVAVGDFNRDGNPDLVVANQTTHNVSVLLGSGGGSFASPTNYPAGFEPSSVAVGDFDLDGNPDLVVANQFSDDVNVLLGNGDGSFASATSFAAGSEPFSVSVGDFNRDGDPDLAVTNFNRNVSVLLGNGLGGFGSAASFAVGNEPSSVAVADLNRDGALDLAVANAGSRSVSVLLNQAPVTTTEVNSNAEPSVVGQLVTFIATVRPAVSGQGTPTGIVTFADGANFLGTGTLDVSGQATLSTFTLGTGYHHITAKYQGDPRFTASGSPVVDQLVNQAASTTTLSSSSNPGLAGQPITWTATVTPFAPGFGPPTGTVLFLEGEDVFGSGMLAGGVASFTTTALAPGSHVISAVFVGSGEFTGSYSWSFEQVVNNPVPMISSLGPASVTEGNSTFTLIINGSNFLNTSTVRWNTIPLTVTSITATQIQATVTTSFLTAVGTAAITVVNPGPGGGASRPVTFTVADAPLTAQGKNLSVTGSKSFSGVVATFSDGNPAATAADFTAIITWDNGTADYGTIGGAGPFTVSGTHTFATFRNLHTITVTILDRGGSSATVTTNVIDPPPPSFVVGTGDGVPARVNVHDAQSGQVVSTIRPYGNFRGGVRVATGDINGDGLADIITAPGPGTAALVKVYDGAAEPGQTAPLLLSFKPYGSFQGGVFLATGDVNGDGIPDIITAPGAGMAPTVKIFSGANGSLIGQFRAFAPSFKGGVTVAAADVNGDGRLDIVAGMGPGGQARVRVFDAATHAQLPGSIGSFLAYGPGFRGGVYVAAGDVNGDGLGDITTGPGAGTAPTVKVFDQYHVATPHILAAFPSRQTRGVRVAVGDLNGDGQAEILTALGPGGSSELRIFNNLALLAVNRLFAEAGARLRGGVFVG